LNSISKKINLDAVSGIDIFPEVKQRILSSFERQAPINTSSRHLVGQNISAVLDNCTSIVLESLGSNLKNGIWTSSATEAHHLVANSINPRNIIVPRGSRLSLINSAKIISKKCKCKIIQPKFNSLNGFDLDFLKGLNEKDVLFIDSSLAEVGFAYNLDSLNSIFRENKIKVLIDVSSSFGWKEIKDKLFFADWVACSFYRFGGPAGVGFLASRADDIKPLFHGVEQEGLRGGNIPLSLIEGAAYSMECFQAKFSKAISEGWSEAVCSLASFVKKEFKVNQFRFDNHLPHVISSHVEKVDLDAFRMNLSIEGVFIGTGPACVSGAGKKSQILEDMNIDHGQNLLISPDLNLKDQDLKNLYEKLRKAWFDAKIK